MSLVLVNPYILALGAGAFADNFDDNSIDTNLWTATNSGDITISETSQQLQMATDASFSGSDPGAFLVSRTLNFTGAELVVDIAANPWTTSGGFDPGLSYIRIKSTTNPTQNYVEFQFDANQLKFRVLSNNSFSTGTPITWSGSITKVRLTEVANVWTFATFASGVWTDRHATGTVAFSSASMKIEICTAIFTASGQSKTFIIDNVSSTATY